jgi:hypothetical protein
MLLAIVRGKQITQSFSKTRSETGDQFKSGHFDASLPTSSSEANAEYSRSSIYASLSDLSAWRVWERGV